MNPRIKQIAQQATSQYSPTYYTPEWIENFALLIVQDCVELVEAQKVTCRNTEIPADVMLDLTSKNIKAYFGVEQ